MIRKRFRIWRENAYHISIIRLHSLQNTFDEVNENLFTANERIKSINLELMDERNNVKMQLAKYSKLLEEYNDLMETNK
jgi:hypothetical protein